MVAKTSVAESLTSLSLQLRRQRIQSAPKRQTHPLSPLGFRVLQLVPERRNSQQPTVVTLFPHHNGQHMHMHKHKPVLIHLPAPPTMEFHFIHLPTEAASTVFARLCHSVSISQGLDLMDRCGNDPSAGSPTETLLRLHLPLNDEV